MVKVQSDLTTGQSIGDKVAAWVAIQGPFHGAELADVLFATDPGLSRLGAYMPEFISDLGGAIKDMQTGARERYHEAHAPEIAAVLSSIPTICYGSYMNGFNCLSLPGISSTTLGASKTDGLVSPISALLDGAMQVVEEDVDHLMPVFDKDTQRLDPVRCLAALLSVRLEIP